MLFSTYNIHYGVGADSKYDIMRAANAVAGADIICLQETARGWPQNGYADQTAEIARKLNRYFRFHGPMETDGSTVSADGWITNRRRSFGNAIVSRWPIQWSRGVMLPKMRLMDGFDLQRGYIEAAIAVPSGPLRVYCTHLSHVGPRQRLPQVTALMEGVKRAALSGGTWDGTAPADFLWQKPAPAVPASAIVAGDFNFTPAQAEYRDVMDDLADTWTAAGNSEEGVDSFPREGRIDHVFVTYDLALKVKKAWIGHGIDASDHWPVFVEFDL
jgi:endonuclease/exonuclease/phosphatase family metal-dependent hydrolase